MNEAFKPVVGYEGLYEVSNLGNIKILSSGMIKVNTLEKVGYWVVKLQKQRISKTHRVHRLLAEAFMDNPENKRTVNHIDGNKSNNTLSNLEWATHSENSKHAFETGLSKPPVGISQQVKGEDHFKSKLTEQDVIYIRKNCKENGGEMSNAALARKFDVTRNAIGKIVKRVNWGHVA